MGRGLLLVFHAVILTAREESQARRHFRKTPGWGKNTGVMTAWAKFWRVQKLIEHKLATSPMGGPQKSTTLGSPTAGLWVEVILSCLDSGYHSPPKVSLSPCQDHPPHCWYREI